VYAAPWAASARPAFPRRDDISFRDLPPENPYLLRARPVLRASTLVPHGAELCPVPLAEPAVAEPESYTLPADPAAAEVRDRFLERIAVLQDVLILNPGNAGVRVRYNLLSAYLPVVQALAEPLVVEL
jgi:hypothetical protein